MSKEKNTPAHLKGMSGEHDLPCGRMLSLEELSPVLRGSVQDLLSQTKESGVLVGAMLGARKWDVRPILLENSQLSIVRFAHPDCTLRDAYRYDVAAYFASLASHVSSSGIVHDQYWIRRPYFDRILIDEDLSRETISGIARPILLRRLLDAVGSLHAQKIFHGHLILSNLVLANDTLQLLDTGLRVLDKEMWRGLDGVPPELREGSPSEQTDVYWMARLIEILAPDIFTGSHPNLCTSMLSAEPGKRPRLMEVSEVLFPDTRKKMHQIDTPSLLRNPSAQLPSGKILAPHVERTKREAPKEQPKTEAREEPVQKAPASSSPSPASVAPSIKPTPPEKAEAQSMLPYLLFILIGLCVYLAYQNGYFSSAAEFPSAVRPYTSLWQAGSVEERHEVARAAVIDNVSEAQKAIVRTALSGKEVPLVANSFIQKAFSSKFGTRFSQDDVRTVLRIALAPMLSDENLSAPDLTSLDPRIVLALIETLGLSAEQAWFPSYPTERFFELPNPAKGIFQSLAQRGEANLSSLLVRATAVLVADPSQQEAWRIVLRELQKYGDYTTTLPPWVPLFEKAFTSKNDLWSVFAQASPAFGWFDQGKIVSWGKVSPIEKLFLFFSSEPYTSLTHAQLYDLITHPEDFIHTQAMNALLRMKSSPGMKETLEVLLQSTDTLTRDQIVALLSAFESEGDLFYSYLSKWFDTGPNPHVVLKLLIARKSIVELDPFNVEAARFLTRTKWEPSLKELRGLSGHPEMLARAFAYSRLNPQNPEERELLRDMASIEPSSRIRTQLQKKLSLSNP